MKKIINGRLYSTETARELGANWSGNRSDFRWYCETLYQKKTGEFFLFGEGGAMSGYACKVSDNSWGAGETIIPLTPDEARNWAEKNLTVEEYVAIFGDVEE